MENDQETIETIAYAIEALDNFLSTDHTFKALIKHVSFQKRLIDILVLKEHPALFKHIDETASFDELYAAELLFFDYDRWNYSIWDTETVIRFLNIVTESDPIDYFTVKNLVENGALALRAEHMETAKEWWFNTYDARLGFNVAVAASIKIALTASKQSDADKDLFTYGKYKSTLPLVMFGIGEGRYVGFEKIVDYLEKRQKGLKHHTTGFKETQPLVDKEGEKTRLYYDYDKFTNYLEKFWEAIETKDSKEALQNLYHGNLFKYLHVRADSRLKDQVIEDRRKKRGGRSQMEVGQDIKRIRLNKNISIEELAKGTGKAIDFIERLEAGKITIYERTILPITNFLEVDISSVLFKAETLTISDEGEDKKDGKRGLPPLQVPYENVSALDAMSDSQYKELLFSIVPEGTTDRKYLEYTFENPEATISEIAQEIGISSDGVKKVKIRIKEKYKESELKILEDFKKTHPHLFQK